jgi:hypothetical protein
MFVQEFQKEIAPVLPSLPTLAPLLDFSAPCVQIPRRNFIRRGFFSLHAPELTRHLFVTGPPKTGSLENRCRRDSKGFLDNSELDAAMCPWCLGVRDADGFSDSLE